MARADSQFRFEVLARDPATGGRRGRLHTAHGVIETPAFMPVGTRATVKGVPQADLEALGAEIILGNTYHLYLRPGHELIRALGGLHGFAAWPHPLLTDSGGFQVFSLGALNKVEEAGVTFRSHLDGSRHQFTPELAIEVQLALGADIIMAFDECTPYPATAAQARTSMELSGRWLERCRVAWEAAGRGVGVGRGGEAVAAVAPYEQALFGIVQGGMYPDLRREAAEQLVAMDLPGYALGGFSVGEPRELTYEVVAGAIEHLPADKPRYLMGVGTPAELVRYAALGVDMMDCVMPTRNARNGLLFTAAGPISIKNAAHARDPGPIDRSCGCRVCARYSRAYLRHLFQAGEILASQLNSHHNLHCYLDTMRRVRHAIELGHLNLLAQAAPMAAADEACAEAPREKEIS